MKILQISASYKPALIYGGPIMSVSMLCQQLVTAGFDIMVYTTTANGTLELPVAPNKAVTVDGVTVIYFKRITKDHTHFSPALLKSVWQNVKQYDVVHIQAWWNLVSVLSCLIAVWRRVPVVISARGTLSPYSFQNKNKGIKKTIHHLFTKPLFKRSYCHVTTQREQEAMLSLVRPKSIFNIANLVKLPLINRATDSNHQGSVFKLIFLSRIEEKKGLDILINALPYLTFPFTLTIAGDGDSRYIAELKKLAKSNGHEQSINWLGFQNENKFELLKGNNLLVLPSYDENFGNVVIESLSQGTAVLLSEFVGLSTYVVEKSLGWQCEPNSRAFARQLNLINRQRAELTRIRAAAPSIIAADFDKNNLINQYLNMYTNIINHGRL
ncbi:XrtY-associated glycosyltransferase XYAG1 [Mucilaginibacter sp. SG564]|uniref:XrtY-associated glycosyltransferase XYAG1 n=1 Tax=Mucilaginibacter sp. SG564 TaxID=2587022 RepID=UPI0015555948|nr:glycosyltransferase [Mucilaginibacter sp. SG564]NOW98783.1 glycosyltransferase involved in cell wall biosynthesis [Mucilaginibacter sp. SG564]